MKRPFVLILLALLALGLVACDGADEEEAEPTASAMSEVEESPMPTEEMEPIATSAATPPLTPVILASNLLGTDVSNQASEVVGDVGELLMDEDGTIRFVIFEVGGFLGVGEQFIAVDWNEMALQLEEDVQVNEMDAYTADALTIQYAGATPLEEVPTFDTDILDEDGYVLSEDPDPDDEFDAAPYEGLFQMSQFEDFNSPGRAMG